MIGSATLLLTWDGACIGMRSEARGYQVVRYWRSEGAVVFSLGRGVGSLVLSNG